jgi:hypothetical protein
MTPASASSGPWADFTQDPRRPQAAPLRASDRDREVVIGVLTEAYADGRLAKEEYDERADATTEARTLGQLPVLISDLVPERPPARPVDLGAEAVRRWESQRRQALSGFLVPTLICWTVWLFVGLDAPSPAGFELHFPWPLFVMLGTGFHLMRVLLHRQDIVADELRRLEKKQRRALDGRRGAVTDD